MKRRDLALLAALTTAVGIHNSQDRAGKHRYRYGFHQIIAGRRLSCYRPEAG